MLTVELLSLSPSLMGAFALVRKLQAPRFDSGCIFSQDPAVSYIWSEKNLNDDQRRAILKVI